MGIILLPILLGYLGIFLLALSSIANKLNSKRPAALSIFIGLLFPLFTYVGVLGYYSTKQKVWAFGPTLLIPFIMVVIPYAISLSLKRSSNKLVTHFSEGLQLSILFSGAVMIFFFSRVFEIERYISISYHH